MGILKSLTKILCNFLPLIKISKISSFQNNSHFHLHRDNINGGSHQLIDKAVLEKAKL